AAGPVLSASLTSLIEQKRADPGDDLLSDLIRNTENGEQLSHEELLSTAFFLLVSGYETTVNLIGNGLLSLLRHPDQLAALQADRSRLPQAIEEFLRYEGPVNAASFRFTTEPVELAGVIIPAGEVVL